ncbi:MAG: GAF domain-containing protein [Chitinophagales bacterium]|nr:GAF domain-containing protein [Chitinophagales bacterium]
MAETSINLEGTKEEKYQQLIPMIHALVNGETNRIANLANVVAALKQGFDFFWVGFYWVDEESLILGPFQGPIACTRIAFGKGVCGSVWKSRKSLIVPNVNEFPGHIACSSASQSEIVIPLIRNEKVIGVLDVDSDLLDDFDTIDQKYLTELCNWLADNLV